VGRVAIGFTVSLGAKCTSEVDGADHEAGDYRGTSSTDRAARNPTVSRPCLLAAPRTAVRRSFDPFVPCSAASYAMTAITCTPCRSVGGCGHVGFIHAILNPFRNIAQDVIESERIADSAPLWRSVPRRHRCAFGCPTEMS
jgi:hypothetical protein